MAVDLIGSIAGAGSFVLQLIGRSPIGLQFRYLYYSTNFKNLEKEVTKLRNTRDEVQVKVTAAERNLEEIKQNVKDWQKDVEKTITEAEMLIQEKANNPPCFKELCQNWITRYKHSKKAFKLKQYDISRLLDKNILPFLPQEVRVSYPTNPPEIWLRSNEDYLAFESRNSTEKSVWDALIDENIYMIGVYGMGGLGKTTLVEEVGRKADKDKLFDDIVFVEITETPDIKKIQTTIANKLGLKFEDESERANKLYSRMEKKNILLIVDNIWEELDLKMVGIPFKADCGRNKILMTTRNIDVLEKMGSTNNFGMGILNEEEAWTLFMKMTGGVIQTHGLNSLPQDTCKECGGLPIVICTIAKALRNKNDPFDWEDALEELRAPSPTKFKGLLENEYRKIALSYKYLRDDELRKTFLISSLMKNDTSISDLFNHVVNLDVLEINNLAMERARNRLDKVVRELKDACLLLEGSGSKQFSMHDSVRAVAITIAYIEHHVFTARNDIEKEWRDKDKLKKCTKISLLGDNVLHQLWHEELDFPNLEFFFMDMKNNSFEIHENLFKKMPKLKVLNLFGMQQSSLPLSIDFLTNLQTLCLDESNIEDIAIIGKLKKLRVLSLRSCDCIKKLTTEIGQLTQLRLLDLNYCWQLEVIASNVISKLTQLEELYIKGCSIQWKVEVLEELKGLSQLTSLELDIKDNKMLPKDFFSKELRRYKITIGHSWLKYPMIYKDEILRMLKFKFNSTISLEEFQGIKNVEILILATDVENSLDEVHSNITPLFNEKLIFPNLMALTLHDINSRKIWDKQLPTFMSSSYKNLTQLTLQGCGNIKYAFPSSIAKSLVQLQQLKIDDCRVLEEIVAKEEGANAVVNFVFPKVTLLKLKDLLELTGFYPERHTFEWPKLKELVVINCTKFTLKHMSFQENSEEGELHISESKSISLDNKLIFTNLMILELCNISSEKIWDNQLPTFMSSSYQNLTQLTLNGCRNIKYAFPSSIAKSLMQLQQLKIRDCKVLEEIVAKEEGANAVVNFVFPNVTLLKLKDLPELTAFYHERHSNKWPKLKELVVRNCDKFTSKHMSFQENSEEGELHISEPKSIFLDDKINSNLEEMELRDKDRWIKWRSRVLIICHDKSANISLGLLQRFENLKELILYLVDYKELFFSNLPNLEVLYVFGCNELMKLITPSTARSLVQLREMSVESCKMLIEIVGNEGDATMPTEIVFNNLKKLSLKELESLTCFCSGNSSFSFPSLEELIMGECPNIKTFFQGILSTPKLHKVIYESWNKTKGELEKMEVENERSDLNKTIQEAYKKQKIGAPQQS